MSKSKAIIFRVSNEIYQQIEELSGNVSQDPNEWCRNIVLQEIGEKNNLTPNEKLLFEELAKTRYLLGIGLGLIASDELNPESWNRTKQVVDEKGKEIADALLKRRNKS